MTCDCNGKGKKRKGREEGGKIEYDVQMPSKRPKRLQGEMNCDCDGQGKKKRKRNRKDLNKFVQWCMGRND